MSTWERGRDTLLPGLFSEVLKAAWLLAQVLGISAEVTVKAQEEDGDCSRPCHLTACVPGTS